MKRDFRLELPEVDPQALLDDEQARERYEAAVRDAVRNESGWEVLSDAVLGQFSFQKLAMYDDYGRHATEIAEHEHCRRIAGDDSTPPPFAVTIPSPREIRRGSPSLETAYHPAVRFQPTRSDSRDQVGSQSCSRRATGNRQEPDDCQRHCRVPG